MHAGIDGEAKVAESFGEDKQNWVKDSRSRKLILSFGVDK